MRTSKYCIIISTLILIISSCSRKEVKKYDDIELIFKELKDSRQADYIKLPPRLVKAYLRVEKSNNGLIDLLDISKEFIVMHLYKEGSGKIYKKAMNDISSFVKDKDFQQTFNEKYENVKFKEYLLIQNKTGINELLLVIDEDSLLSVYCLKGSFNLEEIEKINKNMSPVEFLRLNKKIGKKQQSL